MPRALYLQHVHGGMFNRIEDAFSFASGRSAWDKAWVHGSYNFFLPTECNYI